MKRQIILILVFFNILIYGQSNSKKEVLDLSKIEKHVIKNYPNDYMRYKIIENQVKENISGISFGNTKKSKKKEIFWIKINPKEDKLEVLNMYVLLFFNPNSGYFEVKKEYGEILEENFEITKIYGKLDKYGNYIFSNDKKALEEEKLLEENLIKIKFNKEKINKEK